MRSIQLFVIMVGIVPLLVFSLTLWLSDGAPFDPMGRPGNPAIAAPAAESDTPLPLESGGRNLAAQPRDAEIGRLQQLAREGDAEAALLLAILDGSR